MLSELSLIRGELAQGSDRSCFTCSFQAEDVVVLHLLRQVQADIPVLFLDTGYHFPGILEYRDRLVDSWQINLVSISADLSREQREQRFGPLHVIDPGECCRMRKVEPLFRALRDYAVWFTGLRREQSPTRARLEWVETARLPDGHCLRKVSPLAMWYRKEVWSYLRANEIPHAPLYDEGYESIGCAPCTTPPTDPGNVRSGRCGGAKLECGIHLCGEAK
jgi:phosphoadenosine phosphosulfate reductase